MRSPHSPALAQFSEMVLIVDTDACDVAIGAVLHQVQEGAEKVATGSELEPTTSCVVGHACLQVWVGISLEGSVRVGRG